jgi:hypothetical protein
MCILAVYRRLGMMDITSKIEGNNGMKRFEFITGTEDELRGMFDTFMMSDQVLAIEIWDGIRGVIARHDRLVDLSEHLLNLRRNGQDPLGYWPVVEAVLEQRVWDWPPRLRRPQPPDAHTSQPPPGATR